MAARPCEANPVLTITTGGVRGVGGVMRATCVRPHISGVMCSDVYCCNILIGGNAAIVFPALLFTLFDISLTAFICFLSNLQIFLIVFDRNIFNMFKKLLNPS